TERKDHKINIHQEELMKKKFLAAVMGAAMVINISPVITFAETAADNGAVAAVEEAAETGAADAASGAGVEITGTETIEAGAAEVEAETTEVETAEAETTEVETTEA